MMTTKRIGIAAATMAAMMAGSAQAQLTLAFDINGFDYEFKDSGGATAFGGDTHTGTVEWSTVANTEIADARISSGGVFGAFTPVALGAGLQDFSGSVDFDNGWVKGGSFTVELDNGDTYTADMVADSGRLQGTTSAGFTLDGLTFNGAFSDDTFGGIDVTEWFSRQGDPGQLFGSLFKFRFSGAQPSGNADMEVFVMVPLPPAAFAGLGMLAAVMGLSYIRRRG